MLYYHLIELGLNYQYETEEDTRTSVAAGFLGGALFRSKGIGKSLVGGIVGAAIALAYCAYEGRFVFDTRKTATTNTMHSSINNEKL